MLQFAQVAGESVLMVVGGDNLADNQESSLEIYNRSGSIKLELKLEIEKYKKTQNVEHFWYFPHQEEVLLEPRPTNSGEKRLLQVFDSLEEHELH